MGVYVHAIECAVPPAGYAQGYIRDNMKRWLGRSPRAVRLIDRVYRESGIETRHSVIRDREAFFCEAADGTAATPSTRERNEMFTAESKPMFVDLARRAMASAGVGPREVTHVVTLSCTGFYSPGPHYHIVQGLGLRPTVQRYHLGFMGCFAAFPALRLARTICQAEPEAVVLAVSVELCTLHVQLAEHLDAIVADAIFADGGAAAVVSAARPGRDRSALRIDHLAPTLVPDSESEMAWTIGERGFEMVLSQYVPRILEANVRPMIEPTLAAAGWTVDQVDRWAIHPGGKLILDKLESSLGLTDGLGPSRSVLRRFGNMSSATVLFVLKEILEDVGAGDGDLVAAMAFGPGLTVEMGLMTRLAARSAGASGVRGQLERTGSGS
ncbi:MAG: type III polyketide synthase [Phycisphaerae bacterium]|nr:type III polyketide synthase [Phycisphaerae bacterium]